jgi:hypothetical protein
MDHRLAKPTPAAIGTASFGTTRRHTTLTRTDCPFWSDPVCRRGAHNVDAEAALVAPIAGDLSGR